MAAAMGERYVAVLRVRIPSVVAGTSGREAAAMVRCFGVTRFRWSVSYRVRAVWCTPTRTPSNRRVMMKIAPQRVREVGL